MKTDQLMSSNINTECFTADKHILTPNNDAAWAAAQHATSGTPPVLVLDAQGRCVSLCLLHAVSFQNKLLFSKKMYSFRLLNAYSLISK